MIERAPNMLGSGSGSAGLMGQIVHFASVAIRNRPLLREMVSRDLKGGVAGHGFGVAWVFIQPLVVVLTFMLIFGVVIGSKIAVTNTFPGDYTSYILAGLVPWLIMANALGRGPAVFMINANLVKQVVFPTEILLLSSVLSCFIVFLPSIALMLAYKAYAGGGLSPMTLLLPAVIVVHGILCLAIIMILAVLTPFMRDIKEFVGVYSAISMYFTPAIFLPDWVPPTIRPVLYFNPFSYVVWVYQDTLFFGRFEHPFAWVVMVAMTAVSFIGGLLVFRRVRPFLGNVL